MRIIMLIGSVFIITTLFAQTSEKSKGFAPRWSVGLDYSSSSSAGIEIFPRVGVSAEYILKPNRSIWTSCKFKQMDRTLAFTTNPPELGPGITLVYSEAFTNAMKVFAVRASLRNYVQSNRKKWIFWYAPAFGYQQATFGSDFRNAVQEADLPTRSRLAYNELLAQATSVFELGSDIGVQWTFTRRFYLEGNLMFLGQYFTTRKDLAFEPIVRFGLGVKF